LKYCRVEIKRKLSEIGLMLNKKTALYPLRQGVKILKWRFIIADSGRIVRKMSKDKKGSQRSKLKKLHEKEVCGEYPVGVARESLVSWLANAERGSTYSERTNMIIYLNELERQHNDKTRL